MFKIFQSERMNKCSSWWIIMCWNWKKSSFKYVLEKRKSAASHTDKYSEASSDSVLKRRRKLKLRNHTLTFGLDLASLFFFFCAVMLSESESSSESVSEPEELSADELLDWATGPLPFSSESLKHEKLTSDMETIQVKQLKKDRTG